MQFVVDKQIIITSFFGQALKSKHLLIQGTIGFFVVSYSAAHLSQALRVTPSLHGHCPVIWSHTLPMDPCGWQLHAKKIREMYF